MYNRRRVFVAACMAMLIFGIMMTTLGSILPSLVVKYGMDSADAGSLFLFMTFGMLIGSIVFGPVVDRFGYKMLLIICAGIIFVGIEGISLSVSLMMVRISLFLIGIGGGVINGGANALVSDIAEEEKSSDLSLLGVFFGLGAFGVPFLLGNFLKILSYEAIIAGIGILILIPMLFFVAVTFPSSKHPQGFPVAQGVKLLKNGLLVTLGMVLFFESGMEMTAGGWISVFMTEEYGVSADNAVVIISLYWLGMMIARIALNRILKSVSPAKVFVASICVSITATLLLIFGGSTTIASIGVFGLGLGLASGFPVILGYVGDMYSDLSGTAFGIVLVMALIGGMLMPYSVGLIGSAASLRISFLLVTTGLVMQFVLFMIFLRFNGKESECHST